MESKKGIFKNLGRLIGFIMLLHTFITIGSWAMMSNSNKEDNPFLFFAVIIVSVVYLLISLLIFINKNKEQSEQIKHRKKVLKISLKVVKIFYYLLSIYIICGSVFLKIDFSTFSKILNIAWLIVSLTLDIIIFILKRMAKGIVSVIKNDKK